MSDIDQVVVRTRRLEGILRTRFHARGRGLHQLITDSEERLPKEVISKLRYIATVRNKMLHEDGFKLEDRKEFVEACSTCEKELTPRSGRFIWGIAIALMTLLTFAAGLFYYVNWAEFSVHL
ncbi:DUF4145 domain-containing protein [Vibrio sp. UCD-FRSSP16_10]|uniref:DUF4145 domain-containing protein n=1 Tax=unclassified Vibrio TaxID=2614977 RepID=UPI0007FE9E4A|nr:MULTISPECIES: DUF4145 domain-containing protein [unclassified Vibrio]OBT10192.1 DUF4145 domain-containing protein [Vibrio sp. UCD-FRSSP16_30]OBT18982.1 DUF4145 domain-containing protein [Vibrio sp. UCD-FRSSP16_10]